jgi:hypothetical protein
MRCIGQKTENTTTTTAAASNLQQPSLPFTEGLIATPRPRNFSVYGWHGQDFDQAASGGVSLVHRAAPLPAPSDSSRRNELHGPPVRSPSKSSSRNSPPSRHNRDPHKKQLRRPRTDIPTHRGRPMYHRDTLPKPRSGKQHLLLSVRSAAVPALSPSGASAQAVDWSQIIVCSHISFEGDSWNNIVKKTTN